MRHLERKYKVDNCTVIEEFSPWNVADSAQIDNAVEFDIPLLRERKDSLPQELKEMIDQSLESLLDKNKLTIDEIKVSSSLLYTVPHNPKESKQIMLQTYISSKELEDESDDLFWEISPKSIAYESILQYIKSELWKIMFG